jgi:predicted RNase H-like HicB family nuclease
MEYKMALQRTEEGFSLFCPGLPGCWSQGATEEEALENIRDAIREYLAAAAELAAQAEIREVTVAG